MSHPAEDAQRQQQLEQVREKAKLIKDLWKESERILDILRTKSPQQERVDDQQILKWAKQLKQA